MEIIERNLLGVYEIILNPFIDQRGFFMRTYDEKIFNDAGLKFNWVQENHSRTLRKYTIRGLHLQLPPFTETKLIRCIRGKILDVFVDLRKGSPSFGQWSSIELSEEIKKMVLIPRGFAHGFCSLTDNCEIVYKVDNFYSPQHECGLIWNDMYLKIIWPSSEVFLSEKDMKNMTFKSFVEKHKGILL